MISTFKQYILGKVVSSADHINKLRVLYEPKNQRNITYKLRLLHCITAGTYFVTVLLNN